MRKAVQEVLTGDNIQPRAGIDLRVVSAEAISQKVYCIYRRRPSQALQLPPAGNNPHLHRDLTMKQQTIATEEQLAKLPIGKPAIVENGGLIGLRVKKDLYRHQPRVVFEVKSPGSKRWQRLGKPGVTTLDTAKKMHRQYLDTYQLIGSGDRAAFAVTASTDEMITEWMQQKYGEAVGDWAHAKGHLRAWQIHWSPVIGGKLFRELTYHDVLNAYTQLMQASKKNLSVIRNGFVWLNRTALWAFGKYQISKGDQGDEPLCLPGTATEAGCAHDAEQLPKQQERQNKLQTPQQFSMLYHALPADDDAGIILRLLMLTGSRKMEVADMEWQELGDNYWFIPENTRTKTKKAKFVPLLTPWRELIPAAPADPVAGQKVFETSGHWSELKGERRYISNGILPSRLNYVLARTLKQLKQDYPAFPSVTVHDLRRSFASLATASTGAHINPAVVEQMIGHKPPHKNTLQQDEYRINIHDKAINDGWRQWSEWLLARL